MAISIKHLFQSAKADGADATLVQPSNWNAEHAITLAAKRLLGRGDPVAGAVEEITIGSGLELTDAAVLQRVVTTEWTTVVKTASENRSAASALDDATLKFAMLTNTKYVFRLVAFMNMGPDLRVGHSGPASPTLVRVTHRIVNQADLNSALMETAYNAGTISENGPRATVFMDGIIHNGANAGNFAFKWGPSIDDGTNITLYAGSYIEYKVVS